MKKKTLLTICLAAVVIAGAITGAYFFVQHLEETEQERQRLAYEAEIVAEQLRQAEELQREQDEAEQAFLAYVESYINEINNLQDSFASAVSRDDMLLYFSEFQAKLTDFQSSDGQVQDIETVTTAFEDTEAFMYARFIDDYKNIYNQIRLSAYEILTQGPAEWLTREQVAQLRNEADELMELISAEGVLTRLDNGMFTERIGLLRFDIINSSDRQPSLVSGTRNISEIQIGGDGRQRDRINGALDIIRQHPDFYELVNTYLDMIRPSILLETSYIDITGPSAGIGRLSMDSSLMWIAGVIVHEAYHSKLYHEYRARNNRTPPIDAWGSGLVHMKVYEVSMDFWREAGAPRLYLDHVQDFTDNYWTMYTPPGRRGNPRPERFRLPIEEPVERFRLPIGRARVD